MGFDALNVALEAIALLKPIIERVELKDADLASQMKRAATSIPLNLAEGGKRRGKDREHMFRTASGSNAELRTALAVAVSWGYVARSAAADVETLLDRLGAMLWRLAPPRG